MISLRRLKVQNYLSLRDVNVKLDALNVLVGPNGAGKSNFLDAIRFLGDVARMDLLPAISKRGGFESILFGGTPRPRPVQIRFEVETVATKHASASAPDTYSLTISRQGSVARRRETFSFKRVAGRGRRKTVTGVQFDIEAEGGEVTVVGTGGQRRVQSVSKQSAALSTLQRLGPEAGAEQVRELAALFETFRVIDIDVAAARKPSAITTASRLRDDASNLAAFLNWLSLEHKGTFEDIEDDLRYILPGLDKIELRPIGGSAEAVTVELVERALSVPTPLAKASYGTVRALALLAMLHDPDPPQLTCSEEIDHGLHPYALDIIVDRLREASERTQLIVATHSPALVSRLRPEELIVCENDPDTGSSRIPVKSPEELARKMTASELTLGELWFAGSLGGVPE